MSDTFAFRSIPVPMRRRVHPRAVKATIVACVVATAVGSFARWTIRSEHESVATAALRGAAHDAGTLSGSDSVPLAGSLTTAPTFFSPQDLSAQEAAREALDDAQTLLRRRGTLAEAGPGQLSRISHGQTFTDGPSVSPQIVSVAADAAAWGVAVMSESGRCFAVRLDAGGGVTYGIPPSGCTGEDALRVSGASWSRPAS